MCKVWLARALGSNGADETIEQPPERQDTAPSAVLMAVLGEDFLIAVRSYAVEHQPGHDTRPMLDEAVAPCRAADVPLVDVLAGGCVVEYRPKDGVVMMMQ